MVKEKFICKTFEDLSNTDLYEILALRQNIFIVEQNCIFQDLDFKDQAAHHCILRDEQNNLLAYTRIFDADIYYENYCSIGRVVASAKFRGNANGKKIMQYSIDQIKILYGEKPIKIGAQTYLKVFYEQLGFKSINQDYIEDGIPHMLMVKEYY